MAVISYSDIKAFKRCRRKWKWRSRLGEYLRPKEVQPQFFIGSAVHHALEHYYGEGEDPVQSIKDYFKQRREEINEGFQIIRDYQEEKLEENAKLGIAMMKHYKKWAEINDEGDFVEVVDTEVEDMVEIPDTSRIITCNACEGSGTLHKPVVDQEDNVIAEGQQQCPFCKGDGEIQEEPGEFLYILDGLVKDRNGLYWIMEHKTAGRMQTDHLPMDEQVLYYLWAAQQAMGIELAGVIYTILKKDTPNKPKRLKNGGFSQAKNQKTTYAKYKQTLLDEFGEIPEEYEKILQYFKEEEAKNGNPFFWRKKITRSQEEISEAGRRLRKEYLDMTSNPRIYPNPTRQCQWDCSFKEACRLKDIGSDYRAELEKNFVKKGEENGTQ